MNLRFFNSFIPLLLKQYRLRLIHHPLSALAHQARHLFLVGKELAELLLTGLIGCHSYGAPVVLLHVFHKGAVGNAIGIRAFSSGLLAVASAKLTSSPILADATAKFAPICLSATCNSSVATDEFVKSAAPPRCILCSVYLALFSQVEGVTRNTLYTTRQSGGGLRGG